jgi:hypothetical protein
MADAKAAKANPLDDAKSLLSQIDSAININLDDLQSSGGSTSVVVDSKSSQAAHGIQLWLVLVAAILVLGYGISKI